MMKALENMMNNEGKLNHEMTEEHKAFLEKHEEMHRLFGRLPKPARVAQDVVINPIIMDVSGSMMMPEENSGSMGGTDMAAIMKSLLTAPVPYSAKKNQMVLMVTDGDPNVTSKFPKPKYEKFSSNEAMVEEKLLTGRGRRSNKEIAEVRREARKLNKQYTAEQQRQKRKERRKQNMMMVLDFTDNISKAQMREFLAEIKSIPKDE